MSLAWVSDSPKPAAGATEPSAWFLQYFICLVVQLVLSLLSNIKPKPSNPICSKSRTSIQPLLAWLASNIHKHHSTCDSSRRRSSIHHQQYEFLIISSKQGLDNGSKCWSCGGLEKRPRDLQVESNNEIGATTCQEPPQIFFSGAPQTLFFILCFVFKETQRWRAKAVRGVS